MMILNKQLFFHKKKIIFTIVILSFILIPQIYFIFHFLSYLQLKYELTCRIKEFLTWDPDLRFISTIQLLKNLKEFNFFQIIYNFINAPTWSLFRNIFEAVYFLFFPLDPKKIIYFTFFTFIILIFSPLFFWKYYKNYLLQYLLFGFFLFWSLLLQIPGLYLYSFSGMLEIQGGLFYLVSLYYFTDLFYSKNETSKYFLAISFFCLYLTKYPYGYLWIFSFLLYYTVFHYSELCKIIKLYWNYLKTGSIKKYTLIILFLIFLFVYLMLTIWQKPLLAKGKIGLYLKYSIFLLLISNFIYFYIQSKGIFKKDFFKLSLVIKFLFFPIIIWTLVSPDRFSNIFGSLHHVQSDNGFLVSDRIHFYLIFLKEVWRNFLYFPTISKLTIICFFIVTIIGFLQWLKWKEYKNYFVFGIFIIFNFLGLTFVTSNHQPRHIYHLYPSIIFTLVLFIMDMFINKKKYTYTISCIFGLTFCSPLMLYSEKILAETNLCFSGNDENYYKISREASVELNNLIKKNTIILNNLPENFPNKPDVEMLSHLIAYQSNSKIKVAPNLEQIDLKLFDQVIIVSLQSLKAQELKINYFVQTKEIQTKHLLFKIFEKK